MLLNCFWFVDSYSCCKDTNYLRKSLFLDEDLSFHVEDLTFHVEVLTFLDEDLTFGPCSQRFIKRLKTFEVLCRNVCENAL